MMQQIEDGYNESGPDGLTLAEKREILAKLTHEFVNEQYDCWNSRLRPALAQNGIRVLGLHELEPEAQRFVDQYCERELDPLLTPVTVDPAHPFPRVINKALCLGFLLRRRRRSALTYTGVVAVPRALPRLVRLPSEGTADFIFSRIWLHSMLCACIAATTSSPPRLPRNPQQQSLLAGGRGPQLVGICPRGIA